MSKIRSWNRQERMCLWKQAHWGRQQWRNYSLVPRQRDAYGEHFTPRLPSQHIWTRAWQFSLVIVRVVGEKRAPLSSFQRAKSYKQITWWTHQTFSHLHQMSRANTFYGLVRLFSRSFLYRSCCLPHFFLFWIRIHCVVGMCDLTAYQTQFDCWSSGRDKGDWTIACFIIRLFQLDQIICKINSLFGSFWHAKILRIWDWNLSL